MEVVAWSWCSLLAGVKEGEDERDAAWVESKERGVEWGVQVSLAITGSLADASKVNCAVLET